MSRRTIFQKLRDGTEDNFPERGSRILTTTLTDKDGVAITAGALSYLKLTLWEKNSGAIINSRDGQSILNVNGGALSGSGVLTLKLGPLDNAIVGTLNYETHRGVILAKLSSGDQDEEPKAFEYTVQNIEKVS